jgi:type IV pilus assembly protein PilB
MKKVNKRIGEMLIEAGFINDFQLSSALGQQRQWGGKIATILIDSGFVDEKSVASVIEKQFGQNCLILEDREIQPEALEIVKCEIAQKYRIIPLELNKNILTLAMTDPTDIETIDELSFVLGVTIKPLLALESSIMSAIHKHYWGITIGDSENTLDMNKLSENMGITKNKMFEYHNISLPLSLLPKVVLETLLEVLTEPSVKEKLINRLLKKFKIQ